MHLTSREEQIIKEFQRRAHHFLPDPPLLEDLLEWRSLIQHFGGPTRLLDFTRSFYVAAFFAIEKASKECSIWCVNGYALYKAIKQQLGTQEETIGRIPDWQVPYRIGGFIAEKIIQEQPPFNKHPFVFEVQPFRLNERLAV